ncbi:hypothetical protein HJG60_008936 [Phyllostomus discolor]|uniref:Uncharacterized protein n=1 Tax=Phyllostomus discolor TaxID=89673 RepID=A0A833YTQ3_9CHIR|nr:hypothetical protein HJG60_008936 [Phyllostomus discolor]
MMGFFSPYFSPSLPNLPWLFPTPALASQAISSPPRSGVWHSRRVSSPENCLHWRLAFISILSTSLPRLLSAPREGGWPPGMRASQAGATSLASGAPEPPFPPSLGSVLLCCSHPISENPGDSGGRPGMP